MAKQTSDARTLFSDNFNGPLSSARWDYNHWQKDNNPSFYGRTQQRQKLAETENGVLRLKLDTRNPDGPSFIGSEAITKQKFGIDGNKGLAFEIKARFVDVPKGLVGGFFTYAGNAKKHDEIDFEAVSNRPTEIQTNVYANEPLGAGHTKFIPLSSTLNDYHTYRIEWTKNEVRWLIDGVEVRSEKTFVPKNAQAMHLNIWAPSADWAEAYNGGLQPNTGTNKSYFFDVDYAKVTEISVQYGGSGNNFLRGTAQADRMEGGRGDDTLRGGKGADTLIGDEGNDVLRGAKGNDDLNGGLGNDVLFGGKGNDNFVFDSVLGPDNVDKIRDFTPGSDTIELSAAVFVGLGVTAGALAAGAFAIGAAATTTAVRILYDKESGELSYDADGSGSIAPVLFAMLRPHLALGAGDFIVA